MTRAIGGLVEGVRAHEALTAQAVKDGARRCGPSTPGAQIRNWIGSREHWGWNCHAVPCRPSK
jgi:hypothetical protein